MTALMYGWASFVLWFIALAAFKPSQALSRTDDAAMTFIAQVMFVPPAAWTGYRFLVAMGWVS